MEKEVSVIIPTYNMGQSLERTIKSVFLQNHGNFELLVIDDGSTDNSQDVARGIHRDDLYYCSQPHKNRSAAINLGVQRANGRYITIVDADDFLPQDSLRKRTDFLKANKDADAIYTFSQRVDWDGRSYKTIGTEHFENEEQLVMAFLTWSRGPFNLATMMYKREVFDRVGGFNEELKRAGDIEFFIRLVKKGCRVKCLPEPLYYADTSYHFTGRRLVNRIRDIKTRLEIIGTLIEEPEKIKCYSRTMLFGSLKFLYELFSRKK